MLVSMMSGFKAGVSNELDAFFAGLANQADLLHKACAEPVEVSALKPFPKRAKNFRLPPLFVLTNIY